MVESRSCVQREGVYRWFSSLTSAQRAEFLCGLLDLCVPIELRFLGSCLEDLARKDYHSLRDAEIKANNPADLSGLTNITDEVVRSKLLVSLALLGSDNREAAGVLYRTLTHIDTVINNYGLALNDGRTEEQFLLLFTMASHHPAFSFHQKQVLRQQLGQIQDILQVSSGGGGEAQAAGPGGDRAAVCYAQPHHHYHHQTLSLPLASLSSSACSLPDASAAYLPLSACQPCQTHCTCWHKFMQEMSDYSKSGVATTRQQDKSQTREAGTVSGPGSGVTVGRRDQAVSQELTPHHPDLHPPLPPPPPIPPPPPPHLPPPLPAGQGQDAATPTKNHQGKAGKMVIERVVLRGVTHKSEDTSEYVFEASWSDGFVSSVVRTQQEVTELLSQLSQAFPEEGVEKFLPQSIEQVPRCLTALPCHVLQHHSVQLFFTSTRPLSPNCPASLPSSLPPLPSSLPTAPVAPTCPFTSSSNLGCTVQYRGTNRAVYRVASVQPVVSTHSSVLTRPSPHLSSLPPPLPPSIPPPQLSSLPPPVPALPTQSSMAGGGDHSSQAHPQHSQSHSYSQHHLHPQTSSQSSAQSLHLSHSLPMSHSHSQSLSYPQSHSLSRSQSLTQAPSQPSTPEQNGILDWLRKLRLHKYYPVFKQLTMEEFLALTEEDLNKYDLTQGAKKKLKTQLELQKSVEDLKMEKRSCSGIARVTPSSHMGPSTHPTSTAGELRVEVDAVLHHHPVSTDSSSSSGYSSSSCSPRTPICCDSTFDRTRDIHRRVSGPDAAGGGPEKDRSCLFILNSSCPTGSSRPTAQVLPVQTDPTPPLPPSCSFGLPQSSYHPQASYPQTLLSPVSNPARILTSPRKPRPPPLCMEDRTKPLGSGLPAAGAAFSTGLSVGMGVRLENLFPGLNMDGSSTLQDSVVCRGLAGGAVGLMVETSSALTSTSNSLHHVSHPPLHFHLSSSSSPSPSGYYSYPPTSSSSSCPSTKSGLQSGTSSNVGGFVPKATASSVPVAAVPGNTYYPPQPTSSPSPSPSSASSLDQSSGHNPSMCVCSSCGCRGNCGAYGALPGYAAAGYLQPFSAGPSLFTLGPLLHLSPLIASSSAAGTGATPFSYPMMVPPPLYRHSPASHDQQQGFAFYQPHGIVGNGGQKRAAGNLSCYNCGANGHRAEECKQPAMDSAQQGTFRLKYTPHADSKDSGD
ncbi:zinc finger CCHC domain-containing protein 14 isoform X2 [Siniperca chuatsi]|uniref:zinc finger CCHC domain-containing protein 14 isoform X2 n=1 Tax=Siniperca chuatsi TaxID=119488 RepID=UPI001CE1C7AA|nr:zinc finger CCHC domain-containing protein 14 isoform X2 [Siniperca chuatsi]